MPSLITSTSTVSRSASRHDSNLSANTAFVWKHTHTVHTSNSWCVGKTTLDSKSTIWRPEFNTKCWGGGGGLGGRGEGGGGGGRGGRGGMQVEMMLELEHRYAPLSCTPSKSVFLQNVRCLSQVIGMGGRAHYFMVSKIQWKPFWLATQLYPQNDWTGWQNGVNDDAQAPFGQKASCASIRFSLEHNVHSLQSHWAGWQAKMASIEFWIPWRNAHGHYTEKILRTIKPCINAAACVQFFNLLVWLLFDGGLYAMFWVCKAHESSLAHCGMYSESQTWLCECHRIVSKF